jgi:hypothetical protein
MYEENDIATYIRIESKMGGTHNKIEKAGPSKKNICRDSGEKTT